MRGAETQTEGWADLEALVSLMRLHACMAVGMRQTVRGTVLNSVLYLDTCLRHCTCVAVLRIWKSGGLR